MRSRRISSRSASTSLGWTSSSSSSLYGQRDVVLVIVVVLSLQLGFIIVVAGALSIVGKVVVGFEVLLLAEVLVVVEVLVRFGFEVLPVAEFEIGIVKRVFVGHLCC